MFWTRASANNVNGKDVMSYNTFHNTQSCTSEILHFQIVQNARVIKRTNSIFVWLLTASNHHLALFPFCPSAGQTTTKARMHQANEKAHIHLGKLIRRPGAPSAPMGSSNHSSPGPCEGLSPQAQPRILTHTQISLSSLLIQTTPCSWERALKNLIMWAINICHTLLTRLEHR